ncbi:hypothetical protein [Burkholderia sp. PU8-34]
MKSTLVIRDLDVTKELSAQSLAAVRGGINSQQIGPQLPIDDLVDHKSDHQFRLPNWFLGGPLPHYFPPEPTYFPPEPI